MERLEFNGVILILIPNFCKEKYKTCVYCFFGGYDDGESKYCCSNYVELDCESKRFIYVEDNENV